MTGGRENSLMARIGLLAGPLTAGLVILVGSGEGEGRLAEMGAVALWMAIWWITEAIPLSVTALLPLVLYPCLGIASTKSTAPLYVNSLIFLFVGGFLIALAMERWNLHRRVAVTIIGFFGGSGRSTVLGFMLATAGLSMWISNTATAVMMVPMALSIILHVEQTESEEVARRFGKFLLIAVAYSASIGGIATLVGTPPNIAFARIFEQTFPDAPPVAFGQWMFLALPLSLLLLVCAFFTLERVVFGAGSSLRLDSRVVREEKARLGPMSFEERAVLAVFVATALLWIFRKDLELGILSLPGWERWFPHPELLDDGTVAIGMAILLFLIPARRPAAGSETPARRILETEVLVKVPWPIVFLFGGGFALAAGMQQSGLSAALGERFTAFEGAPPWLAVGAITGGMTFLTEMTSNTATTELVLPVLASTAVSLGFNPLLFMVPATLAASLAFMLPAATPPNAVVFGSNRLRVMDLARVGIILNLVSIVLVSLALLVLLPLVFGVGFGELPEWARK